MHSLLCIVNQLSGVPSVTMNSTPGWEKHFMPLSPLLQLMASQVRILQCLNAFIANVGDFDVIISNLIVF
jgi:hypothetical protein